MQARHGIPDNASPFHPGEQAVQARLGVRDAIEPWGRQVLRPSLSEQHRGFFHQLPFVVAAARDATGRPWVTLLAGAPGFITTPDSKSLRIATPVLPGDALKSSLTAGAELGLLGIELETRRRNRVNGTISAAGADGLTVTVSQAYGNCPQYITTRRWHRVSAKPDDALATHYQGLTDEMHAWITSATTLFIGSGYRGEGQHKGYGMDASHRGGAAGFVTVVDDKRLILPDYSGNNYFNTIGNLVEDPRAALLFVDFETGSLLQISGRATIDWDSAEVAKHPGAQRLIAFDIEQIVQIDGGLPLRWSEPDPAHPLRLVKKTKESEDVTSFEFVALNDREMGDFTPGQHLPIEVQLEENTQRVRRTYSLSNAPGQGRYRITVKRELKGAVSRYLHDKLTLDDVIYSQTPRGDFVLAHHDRPVALISAGVGVTPMVSMLHSLAEEAGNRPVYFIHSARDGNHHALAHEVRALAERHDKIRLSVVYSRPRDTDQLGKDYQYQGRMGIDLLKALVPELNADFYLCGPESFLADTVGALSHSGVQHDSIHTETF